MADRRRLNGPSGPTTAPVYASTLSSSSTPTITPRTREPTTPRKIFLQTNLAPRASGSAYYELAPAERAPPASLSARRATPKIAVTVHGPRPLPRGSAFAPTLTLTAHVKLAPFAQAARRAHVRDAAERDLSAHVEAALRGVVAGARWPKAGVEVACVVLEAEEGPAGMLGVLAGCVTAGCAALVEAGIDCVDVAAGGVAAVVDGGGEDGDKEVVIVDPSPAEHADVRAVCAVGYLAARDELVEVWMRGDAGEHAEALIEHAVGAAAAARTVAAEVLRESAAARLLAQPVAAADSGKAKG